MLGAVHRVCRAGRCACSSASWASPDEATGDRAPHRQWRPQHPVRLRRQLRQPAGRDERDAAWSLRRDRRRAPGRSACTCWRRAPLATATACWLSAPGAPEGKPARQRGQHRRADPLGAQQCRQRRANPTKLAAQASVAADDGGRAVADARDRHGPDLGPRAQDRRDHVIDRRHRLPDQHPGAGMPPSKPPPARASRAGASTSAGEVRSLAQRASAAAKEIKTPDRRTRPSALDAGARPSTRPAW